MRVYLLGLLLLATGASADAGKLVVAPAGVCAGEERDLLVPPAAKPEADEAASALEEPAGAPPVTMPAAFHLSPTQVASGPDLAGLAPPVPPAFAGPGACDHPGSGCALEKVLDDPDPGTGCGLPGSPCP
ncbi:MAG TPA: hypothetical protein VFT98_09280 [Myxococcota bacterium]|nr:hypothetical protein [Myxococcota bacterium]